MNQQISVKQPSFARQSLYELFVNIVGEEPNLQAIRELHENRELFHYKDRRHLLLVDYLLCLTGSRAAMRICNNNRMLLEGAYDLTLSKFYEIPNAKVGSCETGGIDCRYYLKAFMKSFQKKYVLTESLDELEMELSISRAFQSFVTRHFYLSCLECIRREKKIYRRYHWQFNGKSLELWMPTEMTGNMCRTWLQSNIDVLDLNRPGERERVQQIVYHKLGYRRLISLDHVSYTIYEKESDGGGAASDIMCRQSLAEHVAQEKSENLDWLPRKIAKLGSTKIKKMIMDIFEQLLDGQCRAMDIAGRYSLDKVTFSRFAGTRWSSYDLVDPSGIPILWKNTARILACDDQFVDAAKCSGLWDKIKKVSR